MFQIKLAETEQEFTNLFQIRHKIFAEEMRYTPSNSQKELSDFFDTLPSTKNFIAISENQIIGGVRFIEFSHKRNPLDSFFDFRPCLPSSQSARVGIGGMLFVDPDYRTSKTLFCLLGMFYHFAISEFFTHITGVISPMAEKIFFSSGYKALADRFLHPEKDLLVTPILLNLKNLNPFYNNFVKRHQVAKFSEKFRRNFYQKGEPILSMGDDPMETYVIISGKVLVTVPDPAHGNIPSIVAKLEPGESFGSPFSRPCMGNLEALENTELLVIGNEGFPKRKYYPHSQNFEQNIWSTSSPKRNLFLS